MLMSLKNEHLKYTIDQIKSTTENIVFMNIITLISIVFLLHKNIKF